MSHITCHLSQHMKLREFKTVNERRKALEKEVGVALDNIGTYSLDEQAASTRNCENMIGVAQVPLGIAGPLKIKNQKSKIKNYYIPVATTEGALVASINRGCKAITVSGGALVNSHRIGATRGPVFYTSGIVQNQKLYEWIMSHEEKLAQVSGSTSRHLTYHKAKVTTVGRYVYVRFVFDTQDAMGMNMVSIATQKIAEYIEQETGIVCLSLSGNFCVDKKVSWQNFINHRGIKAWAEITLTPDVLRRVLKTTAQTVHDVWQAKCMLGSVMSGSLGYNAQAANVIAALFLATGQDPGHIGEGSMAVTTTEVVKTQQGENLYVSVYLPDLMVGTVGGGTGLATQQEALKLLGVSGSSPAGEEGKNSQQFAEIVAASVLAGEISLLASLEEGTLAKAHVRLGRGRVMSK